MLNQNNNIDVTNHDQAAQNNDTEMQQTSKKHRWKKSYKAILTIAISTGLIASYLIGSFLWALIPHVKESNQKLDTIIASTVLMNEPKTFMERWSLYQEIRNIDNWDCPKHTAPVLEKARESAESTHDNYHIKVANIVYLSEDRVLSCSYEIDVDGTIAHGFADINYYDQNISKYDDEADERVDAYYVGNFEFYRILQNKKLTTYVSFDGENWLSKEGFEFNKGNVLFDIASYVRKFNEEDSQSFPSYGMSNGNRYISLSFDNSSFDGFMTECDALYYEHDDWAQTYLYLNDNYMPQMIGRSMAQVDEIKLLEYFNSMNDPILNQLCKTEMRMWPIYKLDSYGNVHIDVPDYLKNAKTVDSFSELFIDLANAIEQYEIKSEWGVFYE